MLVRWGRGLVISAVCSVFVQATYAQTNVLTWPEALKIATEQNPVLQASQHQYKAAQAGAWAAFGAFGPQASAGASWSRDTEDTTPSTKRTPHSQNLTISQPLTFMGEWASWSGAKAQAAAQAAVAEASVQNTVLAAIQAYTGQLVAVQTVSQTSALVKALTERLKASEKRFKFGEDTATNVAEAQARLALAEAEQAQASAGLTAAQGQLARVLVKP
jgi:outer membrane protein TolC